MQAKECFLHLNLRNPLNKMFKSKVDLRTIDVNNEPPQHLPKQANKQTKQIKQKPTLVFSAVSVFRIFYQYGLRTMVSLFACLLSAE